MLADAALGARAIRHVGALSRHSFTYGTRAPDRACLGIVLVAVLPGSTSQALRVCRYASCFGQELARTTHRVRLAWYVPRSGDKETSNTLGARLVMAGGT